MNSIELNELLTVMIQHKTPVTPMLWGQHGIGKSAVVHQIGRALGYRVLVLTLSQREAIDLQGILYTFEDRDLGLSVTAAHPPQWFAEACARGNLILFLDEFNMARREVLNASFELVLDRRLNNMRLADSVFVVCAGNPEDDRYDVTPLSESLCDRLLHVHVQPDLQAWLMWSQNNPAIDPAVRGFLASVPDAAYARDERDAKFPVKIKHSLRSWERVSTINRLPLSNKIKLECFRGIVGADLAIAFVQSQQNADLPLTPDEIKTGEFDDKLNRWLNPESIRMDLLSASAANVTRACQNKTLDVTHAMSVVAFLLRLPLDLIAATVIELSAVPGWGKVLLANDALKARLQTAKTAGTSKT